MSFDRFAPFYDALARLVFGHQHRRAEAFFLAEIPRNARVLIVGGGTGQLLDALLLTCQPAAVAFVEASAVMRQRARRRVATRSNAAVVEFLGSERETAGPLFDVLITAYVLDVFTDAQLQDEFLLPLLARLQLGGTWLFTDFVHPPHWPQRVLLRAMYLFFRVVCRIPARRLPHYGEHFSRLNVGRIKSRLFLGGMIESAVLVQKF